MSKIQPTCPHCSQSMKLVRTIPAVAGAPGIFLLGVQPRRYAGRSDNNIPDEPIPRGDPSCRLSVQDRLGRTELIAGGTATSFRHRGRLAAPVHDRSELESAFAAQAREPNGSLVVLPDSFLNAHSLEVTSLAA